MDIQVIHVVLGKANPERMNGVNKVVNSLATSQRELGYEVSLWGITKKMVINFPERNYPTELFLDTGKFTLDGDLENRLKELPPNTVFHIHGGFISQFYLFARKLKRMGFEYVYTPHGAYNTVALQRSFLKKKLYIELFEKYVVKNAKYLHFIGASEISGAQKVFGNVPHKLIPNGQNIKSMDFWHQALNTGNIPVFGFVGRIDIRTKGLDILLKGFAEYTNKCGGVGQLWVVGDGDELPALMELAQSLNVSSKLKFLGSKYGGEKLNIMANFDFLCLTSRNEGLPGVVLEASALKVPCIVSSETNMGEYIAKDHAGLVLSENNPNKLAKAFQKADAWHRNGELKQVAANAQQMVKKHFDWRLISQKLMNAYAA